jgi:hypothetical protein
VEREPEQPKATGNNPGGNNMKPTATINGIDELTWAILYARAKRDVGELAPVNVFNRRFNELLAEAKATG